MNFGLRWRLTLMMFLEFAIWGAWSPILGAYLGNNLHFSGGEVGWIYGMLPLASIFSPMFFGQLADRYVPTERLIAALHLVGAVLLWYMADIHQYWPFLWVMLLYSIVYAPTLVLTNSLSFDHLSNSEKEFGGIRAGGTLGWIAAGYALTAWLSAAPGASQAVSLKVGAIASLAMGVFSFFLPHTPPKREGTDPLAFMRAFRLLGNRNFLIFMAISFVVATELMFYYQLTAPFIQSLGVDPKNTSSVMTIAQWAELFVVGLVLPYVLPRWGVRTIMVIGILAWPIRYAVFALAAHTGPSLLPLAEAALTLHGFCYVFFFVVGFIYVDTVAPPDIRASAQSLIGVITLGAGMYAGSILAGQIKDLFTYHGVTFWARVFLVPCVLTVLCAIVFPLIFKDDRKVSAEQETDVLMTAPTLEAGPQ